MQHFAFSIEKEQVNDGILYVWEATLSAVHQVTRVKIVRLN